MAYIPYATGPRSLPFSDMSRQLPLQKRSRFLIRQAPLKSISDTERVSYILEIEEYLLPNGMQTGRVFVMKDRFRKDSRAVIPLELCEELRKQLLSCAELSLGNSAFQNAGAAAAAAGGTITNASTQQESGPKIFDLSKLNSVEIKNEQLNFQFAIGSVPPGSADEQVSEKSRRWISTSPLVPNTQDGATPKFDPSQQWMPWNDSGSVEIYEPLIPDLIWFLMDAAIRYRTIDTPPTVNALYSMSGDRRFYFDLRNTRWGHRLFLSQVTDLHRNVIAIPVETLTDFRDRINTFIEKLHLEENKHLRDTLQVHSVPQRYWKRYPKIRPNFINGAYAPTRPPTYLDATPVAAEAAVGAPIGTFTPPTNVKRTRQISSSKGNSKSRTRTISRTSNTAASATDAGTHRTRQISTSSKGASRPARQPNNQPRDGTHRRQTPNKQNQQQQSQQQKQQPQEQQQPQAPKDRSPNSNHAAQQVGGAPQFSRNKDRSDQQNAAQPKPIPSSSRPQQQQQQQRQPHWQQTSRQRQPNANRSAQQSGEVSGPPRGKPLNAPGEAHDPQSRIPQSAPKPQQQQQQQQQNRSQAPTAWNQTAQRATLEAAEVSNRSENAPGGSVADGRTKPQHPAPEQKAQQGQNQQRPLQGGGGARPAEQRPVPTPAAAAAPTHSAKLEQPKPQQQHQQQNAPKPASNAPRSPHGGAQQTQGQTTPQQPRGQQQMLPKQELETPNVASGEEEKAEKEAAAVTAEETTASASVSEQASAAEANTATGRKPGKKRRSKKKRDAGAGDSGQGESEPSKEENGKVEDNAQEPVAV